MEYFVIVGVICFLAAAVVAPAPREREGKSKRTAMEYDPVMAQPFVRPATHHKRGNRLFGSVLIPVRGTPTEFELHAQQLGLTKNA